ncbi:MAG: polyphenol oxidase family protein [Acidimicrobiales bacterium]
MANVGRRMCPSDSRVRTSTVPASRLGEREGIEVLTWPAFDGLPVEAVVTARGGGVSTGPFASLNLALHVGDEPPAVLENRRRALRTLGATLDDLVVAEQVHGASVRAISAADAGRGSRSVSDTVPASDAMVTTDPGVILAVLVADCAPVVLCDPEVGVLGCAHGGWRGTLGGVLESTIGAMGALGASTERIVAGVGPTVARLSYEVGPDVAGAATAKLGHGAPLEPSRPGHWWFDLAAAVNAVLVKAGIDGDRISMAAQPTGPDGPFYSARAEGPCGRFAALARIRS